MVSKTPMLDCGLAWAAGVVEAAGRMLIITSETGKLSSPFTVQKHDRAMLDRLVRVLGVGKVKGPYVSKNVPEHYRFIIHSVKDLVKMVDLVGPHLSLYRLAELSTIISTRQDALRRDRFKA